MGDYYNSLSTLGRLYFLSALVGGSLFTISMLLQILGGDGDSDVEFDGDVDAGGADPSFKILSIQGITAFSLMFGLTGLSLVQDFGLTAALSCPWLRLRVLGWWLFFARFFRFLWALRQVERFGWRMRSPNRAKCISQSLRTVRDKSSSLFKADIAQWPPSRPTTLSWQRVHRWSSRTSMTTAPHSL